MLITHFFMKLSNNINNIFNIFFKKIIIYNAIILFLLTGCQNQEDSATSAAPLKPIHVLLEWTPNTNHSGVYIAKALGFYEQAGLDVSIQQAGQVSPMQMLATKQVDIAFSSPTTLLFARAAGMPVISIAAVIQHNTSGFYAKQSSGIHTPKDLQDKTYGSWNSPVERKTLETVMQNSHADASTVNFVNIGQLDFFKSESLGIDFVWGYEAWTGIQAKILNVPFTYLPVRDYEAAFDYPTPLIITHEALIQSSSSQLQAFLNATRKGYEFAIQNPEETANLFLQAVPEASEPLIRQSQLYLAPHYQADATTWGIHNMNVLQQYADWLYEQTLIPAPIRAEAAFTNQFIQ